VFGARPTSWLLAGLLAPLWLFAPTASDAQDDRSVDLDLTPLRTTCQQQAGVDAVDGPRQAWCAAATVRAIHQPLVVRSATDEVEPIIAWQAHARLGGAIRRGPIQVGATVPVVWQLEAEGSPSVGSGELRSGLGDLAVNSSVDLYVRAGAAVVLNADLRFPSGVQDTWIGEKAVRALIGSTVSSTTGKHGLHAALTVEGPRLGLDPSLGGARLFGATAWRWQAGERLQTQLAMVFRANTSTRPGVATLPVELRAGARVQGPRFDLDFSLNRAIVRGVGSATVGLQIGATWHPIDERLPEPAKRTSNPADEDTGEFNVPRVVRREPVLDPARADEPLADLLEPDPEPDPEPASDAVEGSLPSLLLDTLYFEVGRTELTPASRGVLDALAAQLVDNAQVGPVLLEGHASEEGSLAYNYDLSLRRCDAIYRALIGAGISPARLVLRPYGEAVHDAEQSVAAQRRVEIRLVLGPDEVAPDINPLTGERMVP
jgi:outer membrane protein OmpA-like peptidoglycan-associated protein